LFYNFSMTRENSRRSKQRYWIIVLSVSLSLLYAVLVDGFTQIFPYINTFIIGLFISFLILFFEFFLYKNYLKRLNFILILFIRTTYYLVFITGFMFTELIVARMIRDKASFSAVLFSPEFQNYLANEDFKLAIVYAFILILTFNFMRQMNAKLGQGNFWNFILGRYVIPVNQERIFMFLKIDDPDEKEKPLSDLDYFTYFNDIFFDITDLILNRYGEIYEYVDNVLVISWPPQKGIRNSNCIRVFFEVLYALKENQFKYSEKYGFIPEIAAALHIGEAIRGEIGDVKTAIIFNGDVLNTTSRILEQCSKLQKQLLVSQILLDRINLSNIYYTTDLGIMELRGKKERIQLYSIEEREFQHV